MLSLALLCSMLTGCALTPIDQQVPPESVGSSRDGYWSADGERILFVSNRQRVFQVYEMDVDYGNVHRLTDNSIPFYYPSYSPDGTKIVLMSIEGGATAAVWTLNADGTDLRCLTDKQAYNADPNWTADGKQIVFHSRSPGGHGILIMNADGTQRRMLIEHESKEYTPVPSPNGSHIALVSERGGPADIWLFDADGRNPRNLTNDPEWNGVPRWTADSTALVYYTSYSVPDAERANGRRTVGSDLFQINIKSGKKLRLTETEIRESGPNISPDGTKLCFTALEETGKQLRLMNIDGSGITRLTGPPSK